MPDLAPFHSAFVFAHVLGVFLFLIAHGASFWVLLRIRSERDPAALRTLLDLSTKSIGLLTLGTAIWFFAGILAGFSGNYWTTGSYWIWASLGLAIVIVAVMTPMGRFFLNRIREAVGVDPKTGVFNPEVVVDPAALEVAVASGRPMLLAAIGLGGVAILTWLMMFKPF